MGNEVFVRFRYYARNSDKREFYSSRKEGGDYLGYVDTGSKDGEFRTTSTMQATRRSRREPSVLKDFYPIPRRRR